MKRLVLFAALLSLNGCGASSDGIRIGQMAPEISGKTIDGYEVALGSMKGKVVVVDFWATWCGPCRQRLPELKQLVLKFDSKPFAILGVSADHKEADLKEFVEADPLPWPNIFDGPHGPINERYHIEYFPTVFVIDAKGKVRFRDVHGPKLAQVVEELLAETR